MWPRSYSLKASGGRCVGVLLSEDTTFISRRTLLFLVSCSHFAYLLDLTRPIVLAAVDNFFLSQLMHELRWHLKGRASTVRRVLRKGSSPPVIKRFPTPASCQNGVHSSRTNEYKYTEITTGTRRLPLLGLHYQLKTFKNALTIFTSVLEQHYWRLTGSLCL